MKLYIIKHKGAATIGNLLGTAEHTFGNIYTTDNMGAGWAVKAFLRKKDARFYWEVLNKRDMEYFEIVAVNLEA